MDPSEGNPKHAIGSSKPGVFCVPPSAEFLLGAAMQSGADKYGAYNWGDSAVVYSIYDDAMRRHQAAFRTGEDLDPDSGLHHLAHVMACCAIVIDAALQGKLIDDRPVGRTARMSDVLPALAKTQAERREREARKPGGDPIEEHAFGPLDDGWIEWHGGECPVPADTVVRIRYRTGNESETCYRAYSFRWQHAPAAGRIFPECDIVAYKVLK